MTIQEIKDKCLANGCMVASDHVSFNADNANFQITEHFKLHEFLTKNTKDTTTIINLNIILELQRLRNLFGSAVGISSSYRFKEYNKSIKGATSSEHIKGNALDTYPINGDIKGWLRCILKHKKTGGVGQYNTFVHIDCEKTRFWRG